jgi:hypothetical protein
VVHGLVRIRTYRHTLDHIQVINRINVVKDLVRIRTYRHTLEHTLVINRINVMYVVKSLARILTRKHTVEQLHVIIRILTYNIYIIYLRIDLNFFSVHEEVNSKMWYTLCNPRTQGCVPHF